MYILSQIFVAISTIILGASYFANTKKNIMLLCVLYCIFYGAHYLLLGAYTGLTMTAISSVRNVWFYYIAKNNKENNIRTLLLFITVAFVSGFASYQDYFSIISIMGNIISTYSVWQTDVKRYRILAIPVSICFLTYAIYIKSLFAIITETFLLIVEFISLSKCERRKKYEYTS